MTAGTGKGAAGQSAGRPPPPPPSPLLARESGNFLTNAIADVVNQTATPFQNLDQPNVSAFQKAQGVVGAAAGLASAPTQFLDNAFARATNSISQALPSFPVATVGSLVIGMPHTHTHPPSLIPPAPPIPLPAIGTVLTGCMSVLIGGMPAARSGDFGLAPTCGSFSPVFEIFTGSSKVFIGGARAARILDMTRQCGPPPAPAGAAAAMTKMQKAMAAAQKVAGGLGKVSKAMGVAGAALKVIDSRAAAAAAAQAAADAEQAAADAAADAADEAAAAAAEAQSEAVAAAAEAAAAAIAAAMMGADLAMDAAKSAMAKMAGKDPGGPPCTGMITLPGSVNVLIGGFPMPSWSDVAKGLKKLMAALARGRRGGAARGRAFCLKCM